MYHRALYQGHVHGSPPLCPLSRSDRQHFFSVHPKHDLQILHALRVVFFTLSFSFERFLDDRGFAFLDLKDPGLDCVFDLGKRQGRDLTS